MKTKTTWRLPIVWMLVLTLLAQGLIPALAQDGEVIQGKYRQYQSAYQAYAESVAAGAPLAETQAKLQAYLAAQKAYQESLPDNGQTASGGTAGQAGAGSPSGADGSFLTAAGEDTRDTSAAGTTALQEPTAAEKQSWFGRMFTKVKETILGKPGAKEMPWWEKVLWSVGRSLVPSFGVMLATALLAPLSPVAMIAGGILVGAALGGIMTYAYEKRMNAKYRDVPKEDAKIWRDVTVSATIEAVMAPFNLATGGLFGMAGPTVGNAIYRVAATQAALGFAGSAVSSSVGGLVKNLWARHYFHYPEKIAAAEKRIDQILDTHMANGTPLTEAEIKELDSLRNQIDQMKGESYSHEDFLKDMKRAAVSSVISGFAGSVLSDRLYTYDKGRWADRLSVKIFGSTAKGKALSSLVSTLPTNFAGGAANAWLEKGFINDDIRDARAEQARYAPGTAAYEYYEKVIQGMTKKRDDISVAEAGLQTMGSSLAVRAAQLSVEALKHNLYDGPKARRAAIDQMYRENDPEWKKANELYEKYQKERENAPSITKIRNPANYARAQAAYLKRVEAARQDWLNQCLAAEKAQSTSANQAIYNQYAEKYDREYKLNQALELGRLQGGFAHVKAMKAILAEQNPELAKVSDSELTRLACQAIHESYVQKAELSTTRVNTIKETFKKYDDYKAGRIQLSEAEAKRLQGQVALISPSQYKAALVEQKVYAMKADNQRWDTVRSAMPRLLNEAESEMLARYGGWTRVLAAEAYANGLSKYKYNPDGSTSLAKEAKALFGSVPGQVTDKTVNQFKGQVNSAIASNLLPQSSERENEFEDMMKTFARTALTTGHSVLIDGVLSSAKDRILSGFTRR